MNRLLRITAALVSIVGIGALVSLAGCSSPQVSLTTDTSYDAAVGAEIVYLKSGHSTPAEATKLQSLRIQANNARAAVVQAEVAGSSTAGVAPLATAAIAAYLAEAQAAAGTK